MREREREREREGEIENERELRERKNGREMIQPTLTKATDSIVTGRTVSVRPWLSSEKRGGERWREKQKRERPKESKKNRRK